MIGNLGVPVTVFRWVGGGLIISRTSLLYFHLLGFYRKRMVGEASTNSFMSTGSTRTAKEPSIGSVYSRARDLITHVVTVLEVDDYSRIEEVNAPRGNRESIPNVFFSHNVLHGKSV